MFLNPPRSIENFTGFSTAPWICSGKFVSSSYGQNTDFPTPLWEGVGGEAPRPAGAGGGGAAKKLAKTEKNRKKIFPPNRSQIISRGLWEVLGGGKRVFRAGLRPISGSLGVSGVSFTIFRHVREEVVEAREVEKTEKNQKN